MSKEELLQKYLNGEMPMHSEGAPFPSEAELEAAEAEFDRIMAEEGSAQSADDRRRKRLVWPRWVAAAAAIAAAVWLGLARLERKPERERQPMVQESMPSAKPDSTLSPSVPKQTTFLVEADSKPATREQPASARPKARKAKPQKAEKQAPKPEKQEETFYAATAADSLNYYLERLEREFAAIDDSINAADLGLLIKADIRLQRIVSGLTGRMVESAINVYHTTDSVSTEPIF